MVYWVRMNIPKVFIPYYYTFIGASVVFDWKGWKILLSWSLSTMLYVLHGENGILWRKKSFNNFFILTFFFHVAEACIFSLTKCVFCGINFLLKKIKIPFSLYRLMSFKPMCSFIARFFHVTKIGSYFCKVTWEIILPCAYTFNRVLIFYFICLL